MQPSRSNHNSDEKSDSDVVPGWDQAKDSARTPTAEKLNPQRVRLWRWMQRFTWICAVVQAAPLIILFETSLTGAPQEFITIYIVVVVATGLTLAAQYWVNLVNMAYPLYFGLGMTLAWNGNGITPTASTTREVLQFGLSCFTDWSTWPYWMLRIAMVGIAVQSVVKGALLVRHHHAADRDAIRFWWRRPVDDVVPQGW